MEEQLKEYSFENAERDVSSLAYSPDKEEVEKVLKQICSECKEVSFPPYSIGTSEEQSAIMFYSYAKHFPELRKGRMGYLYRKMNELFALYIKAKHLRKEGNEAELSKVLEEIKELHERIKRTGDYLKRRLEFSIMRKNSMGENISPVLKTVTEDNVEDSAVKEYRKLMRESF